VEALQLLEEHEETTHVEPDSLELRSHPSRVFVGYDDTLALPLLYWPRRRLVSAENINLGTSRLVLASLGDLPDLY